MRLLTLPAVAALTQGISCLKLFNSTSQLPVNMTDACKEALTADFGCGPRLFRAGEVAVRMPSNMAELEQYCNADCVKSMEVISHRVLQLYDLMAETLVELGNLGT